jgi:hypothetical protein
MRKLFLLLIVVLCGVGLAAAQDEADLRIDASAARGAISPYVYGSNMNLYSIVPMSLMDEAQAMGLRFMRFGGGDTDRADMRANILDLFVLQTRQVGAEPSMSVRLLGGTPESAAEWVRYANIEKGYNIRYWSIGNEPNLFVALMGAETYTVEDLSTQWRAIAEAMLEVDPTIELMGPDITQYIPLSMDGDQITFDTRSGAPFDAEGSDWLIPFLEANGDLLSHVAIHRYPYPGNGGGSGATIEGLRAQPQEWDVVIPNLRTIIREAAGRDIPIAITEINSNSSNSAGGPASLDSHYNAIWLADTLGRLINNQVEVVAYWDMQGGAGRGWGLLSSYNVRPTGYVYMMYTHFGTELLTAESSDPLVTIYAARRDDGALTLLVINLGDDEATKTLSINGFEPGADAEVWRFDQDHNAEQIEPLALADGTSITVPGQSVTVYVIPAS